MKTTLVNGEPNGQWDNESSGALDCNGLYAPNVIGLIWEGTTVRNVQNITTFTGGGVPRCTVRNLNIHTQYDAGVGRITNRQDHNC